MKKTLLLILTILAFASCTKQPDLKGFDTQKWKADHGGCMGERTNMIEALKSLKQELKGVSATDFADIFGKPDIELLTERNQKYYVYYLEEGTHCQNISLPSEARNVAIRFSAIGLATEITFQKGTPTF